MRTVSENLFRYRHVLFPEGRYRRILMHALFWSGFILFHLLFFVPAFRERVLDPKVMGAYVVYYGRYIPLYYGILIFYQGMKFFLMGPKLFLMVTFFSVVAMHLVTILIYQYYESFVGLEQLPPNFSRIGALYLLPFGERQAWDWSVVVYDLLDLQLLVLPVGLRMMKHAIVIEMDEMIRQKEKFEAELRVLKSQLTPHFVLNVLNSASAEVVQHSRKGARFLAQAADMIRFALYETGEESVALEKELHYIGRYIELETMRTKVRSEISFQVEGQVKASHRVPTLMLITVLENAFKHSVHASPERSSVRVRCQVTDDWLNFTVANSIPEDRTASQQGGIGLANLRRTLEIKFPLQHHLEVKASGRVFQVEIGLPLSGHPN